MRIEDKMLLEDKRIFIVEDNPANLAIMTMMLKDHGAKVFYDRWGMETKTRLIDASPIDLIVLDLMFPRGITGFDIYDQLQATAGLSHIPVVMVTANNSVSNMKKAREMGFKAFISKPIATDTFPDFIARVLSGEEVWEG
jgi:CheY-like chemotaxis protein